MREADGNNDSSSIGNTRGINNDGNVGNNSTTSPQMKSVRSDTAQNYNDGITNGNNSNEINNNNNLSNISNLTPNKSLGLTFLRNLVPKALMPKYLDR